MSIDSIDRIIRKLADKANLESVSSHTLMADNLEEPRII